MNNEPSEPEPAERPAEPDETSRRQERIWLSAGALVGVIVAGLAIAVIVLTGSRGGSNSGGPSTQGRSTAANPGQAVAVARDESLRAAEEYVIVLNSLDYRNAAENLNRWESVSSSPLLDELRSKRTDIGTNAEKNKVVTTAKLLFGAVSKISPDNSSAEVLVAVELTVNDNKGAPTVKQVRQRLTMIHIGEGWKASTFANVEPPN